MLFFIQQDVLCISKNISTSRFKIYTNESRNRTNWWGLSHEFIILADTGESKIFADKKIFEIEIDNYKNDQSSLKKMRDDFSKFYAVTDDKFKKDQFDNNVKKRPTTN